MALKGRILALWLVTAAALQAAPGQEYIEAWLQERLREAPEWFASAEAARIADNLLLYQRENGGWRKGQDAHKVVSDREKAAILKQKSLTDTMLDNGATHTQIRFLARVHQVNPQRRFRAGILKGIDWLLAAQYANGGWPQCWPDFVNTNQHRVSRRNPDGLTRFITFNDDVMVSALRVLDAVARSRPEFAFVDETRRRKAADAVSRGWSAFCAARCRPGVSRPSGRASTTKRHWRRVGPEPSSRWR